MRLSKLLTAEQRLSSMEIALKGFILGTLIVLSTACGKSNPDNATTPPASPPAGNGNLPNCDPMQPGCLPGNNGQQQGTYMQGTIYIWPGHWPYLYVNNQAYYVGQYTSQSVWQIINTLYPGAYTIYLYGTISQDWGYPTIEIYQTF